MDDTEATAVIDGQADARVLRSWQRSALNHVDPEMGTLFLDPARVEPDTQISQAAGPILSTFQGVFCGTRGLVFLTDAKGRLCGQWAPERSSRALFDAVGACEGAQAAEEVVGTNAPGTALEDGRPILLRGEEHYQHTFNQFACAAAVVRQPVTRRILGTIGLASPLGEPGRDQLLLELAIRAAREVEQALLDQATVGDRLVLQELKVRARGTDRMVVGMSRDVLMANDPGIRVLHHVNQPLLLERARDVVSTATETTIEIMLDDDPVSVRCIPVLEGRHAVGAVLEFSGVGPLRNLPRSGRPPTYSDRKAATREPLVGRSYATRTLRDQIDSLVPTGEAVLLSGEPGSGKTHTAQQILSRRFPQTTPCIIECSSPEKVDGFLDGATRPGPVILAHVDHLAAPAGYRVREVILRRTAESGSLVATANLPEPRREQRGASPVLDAIDTRVDVPTLRSRREDIEPLGKLFAAITCGGGRRLRNDAIHLLLRYPWPGNVRELKTVVTEAAHRARREIVPEDLPKDIRRLATRRPLGPLEQAEADAILQALHVCNNNKVQAAALLQISRSRLYRKMREYGLVGAVLP